MTWSDPDWDKIRSRCARLAALLRQRPGRALALVTLLLLTGWGLSGLYQVGAGETAWVIRLGVPIAPVGPGVHWRLPWPLAHVERVQTTRVHMLEIGSRGAPGDRVLPDARMLTADQQVFDLAFTVDYTVRQANDWLFRDRAPEAWVQAAAEDAMRTVVAGSTATTLLDGKTVAHQAAAATQRLLDQERVGVRIEAIHLLAVRPPASVGAAWADAAVAAQDRHRLPDAARAAAAQALDQARAAAAQRATTARQQAQQTLAAAQADAAAFNTALAAWQKNPSYGHDQLYLDTLRDVLAHSRHVVVDLTRHHGPLVVQLGTAAAGSTPASPASPATSNTPQTAPATGGGTDDWRSRDGMRSRDREYR